MGYSPWGHKESDTTERLFTFHFHSVRVSMLLAPFVPPSPSLPMSVILFSTWQVDSYPLAHQGSLLLSL